MFEDIERQFFKDEDEKLNLKSSDINFSFAVNNPVEMQKILKRETFEPPMEIARKRDQKKSNA